MVDKSPADPVFASILPPAGVEASGEMEREHALRRLHALRWTLPVAFLFCRDEANQR
jgi:hypothetical protein